MCRQASKREQTEFQFMTNSRRRIIIAVGLVVAVLLAFAAISVRPDNSADIERSRSLRIGMTRAEVEAIMGADVAECEMNGASILSYGSGTLQRHRTWTRVWDWMGLVNTGPLITDFPVHVRFNQTGRVDRIERDAEVEASEPS
jgi:hypothetical protein